MEKNDQKNNESKEEHNLLVEKAQKKGKHSTLSPFEKFNQILSSKYDKKKFPRSTNPESAGPHRKKSASSHDGFIREIIIDRKKYGSSKTFSIGKNRKLHKSHFCCLGTTCTHRHVGGPLIGKSVKLQKVFKNKCKLSKPKESHPLLPPKSATPSLNTFLNSISDKDSDVKFHRFSSQKKIGKSTIGSIFIEEEDEDIDDSDSDNGFKGLNDYCDRQDENRINSPELL